MLVIASDSLVNGRPLDILPREDCSRGNIDPALDDYPEGTPVPFLQVGVKVEATGLLCFLILRLQIWIRN